MQFPNNDPGLMQFLNNEPGLRKFRDSGPGLIFQSWPVAPIKYTSGQGRWSNGCKVTAPTMIQTVSKHVMFVVVMTMCAGLTSLTLAAGIAPGCPLPQCWDSCSSPCVRSTHNTPCHSYVLGEEGEGGGGGKEEEGRREREGGGGKEGGWKEDKGRRERGGGGGKEGEGWRTWRLEEDLLPRQSDG